MKFFLSFVLAFVMGFVISKFHTERLNDTDRVKIYNQGKMDGIARLGRPCDPI